MAVALNGTQQNGLLAPATLSVSVTVPVGTSTAVILLLRKSTTDSDVTGVTLNSASPNYGPANSVRSPAVLLASVSVFHNPASGAQTLSITNSANPSGTNAGTRWVAIYLSGTDTTQTTWTNGVDQNFDQGSTSATYSVTLSGVYADGIVLSGCAHEGAAIMTAKGTGQTGAGGDADGFVDEGNWNSAFTYELTASAGSDTQSFTNGASDILAGISNAFKPAVVVPRLPPPMRHSRQAVKRANHF